MFSRPDPFNATNGDFKLTVNTNTSRSGRSDEDRKRLRTLMFYLCLVNLMCRSCHPLFVAVVSAKVNIGHFRCKRSLGKITRYRVEAADHTAGSSYDMSVAIRDWAVNPAHSTSTLSDGTRYLNALIQCLKATRPFVVAIEGGWCSPYECIYLISPNTYTAVGSMSLPRVGIQETVATILSRVFATLDGSGSEPSLTGLWVCAIVQTDISMMLTYSVYYPSRNPLARQRKRASRCRRSGRDSSVPAKPARPRLATRSLWSL